MVILSASYLVAAAPHLTGCGGAQKPEEPSAETRRLIAEAETQERARRYDLARVRYQKAVDAAPTPASAAFAAHRFASALAFWGELEPARAMLETAVARDPGRASAWHDLGVIRVQLGDLAGAEMALRRAVDLARGDPRPRIALAALLVKTHRYREAEVQYRELRDNFDLPPRLRAAVDRALELLRAERQRQDHR